ncbi:MAG: APC family permease [Planctomycetota bacterium]
MQNPYDVLPESGLVPENPASRDGHEVHYGMMTLTCVVIASMIGSGVFTTSGYSLGALGSPLRVLAAWLIGGGIALCGAVSYGELARRLPLSGGEYVYLSRRLHPFMGFLAGWVSLTAGFSGAIAMAAITFEAYAVPDSIRPDWLPTKCVAIGAIVLFGLGHAFLVRLFAALQNSIVAVKIVALVVFLLAAAAATSSHEWHWEPIRDNLPRLTSLEFLQTMSSSVMWISLSYAGFNAAVYVASEVKSAEVVVPRSLIFGTVIVTILYLLLNAVFVSAVPGGEIESQNEVAAIAARAIGGNSVELLIRFAIGLGTLSSVAGMIMTGPRVFSRMADDGVFPRYFASGESSIPRTVLLQMTIASLLVMMGNLKDLLDYLSTTLALSSAVTVATLFRSQSGPRASLKVQVTAGVYVLATFVIAALMTLNDYRDLMATAVTVLVGTLLWFIARPK